MKSKPCALLGVIGLLMPVSGWLAAADWPSFRGDAQQTGAAASALPAQLEVLWKLQTKDSIEATAAIVGDTVYVACMNEHLYAFNLADGKEKWAYKAGAPIKASPGVREGAVYFGDLNGVFHCVDAARGTRRWTFPTEAEIISSANFDGGNVLFGASDEHLYCLNGRTGAPLWKFKTGGAIESSPTISEGRVFITGCDPALRVINTADGKEVASIELNTQGAATAAIVGDYLYVGSASRSSVLGVQWKEDKAIWEYQHPEKSAPFHSSAAVAGDLVVIGGRDKLVHAIDRKSGDLKWSFPTRGKVDSSPVIVGGRVFIGSMDGTLYALDLKTGTKLWQEALGSAILASPAVGGNRLVIGTRDGMVYCFGAK